MYEYQVKFQWFNRPSPDTIAPLQMYAPQAEHHTVVQVNVASKVQPYAIRNDVYPDFAMPEFTDEQKQEIVAQALAQYAEHVGHVPTGFDNVDIQILTFPKSDYER